MTAAVQEAAIISLSIMAAAGYGTRHCPETQYIHVYEIQSVFMLNSHQDDAVAEKVSKKLYFLTFIGKMSQY